MEVLVSITPSQEAGRTVITLKSDGFTTCNTVVDADIAKEFDMIGACIHRHYASDVDIKENENANRPS